MNSAKINQFKDQAMSYLLPDCSGVLFWFADCAVVIVKPDTKEQVHEVISSLLGTHNLFKVRYALLVENKSMKVPLFEDRLPLPADTGITGTGVLFGFEPIILCYHFEDHRADLSRQTLPATHRKKISTEGFRETEGKLNLEIKTRKTRLSVSGSWCERILNWVQIVSFK